MANPNDPDAIAVAFVADPGSERTLQDVVADAISAGFKDGFDGLGKIMAQQASLSKAFKPLQQAVSGAFDPKVFASATRGLEGFAETITDIIGRLKKAGGVADTTINASIRGISSQARQEEIKLREITLAEKRQTLAEVSALNSQRNIEAQRAAQRENIIARQAGTERLQQERASLDAIGREQRSAADLASVQARVSGRQRVQFTKAALDSILSLERGLGTAISGIARTSTSAVSKVFSTLASSIHRSNSDFTEGLSTAMNRRESTIRESFRTQERIISSSVTRQEKQITELRTLTSKGLAGAVTGRGIGFGIGGLVAGIGIGSFLKEGFQDSVNFTEQLNKNKVVFGAFSNDIINFSKSAVTTLGTTQAAALEATGTFGNLFRAVGLSEEQSAKFSTSLTLLATDLASFNNSSPEEAFIALRAGLVGENEPLKKFGVNLTDATLKAKALELGLYNGKGILDANAKAQAAYALILEQTTLAQGDYARTAHEGANAQRGARAAALQFASVLTGKLKGAITGIANAAIPFFTTLTNLVTGENLSTGLKILRDGLQGAATGLAAVVAAKGAVEVIKLLGVALNLALTPMGLILVGAAAIGAAVKILSERSATFRKAIQDLLDKVKELAGQALDKAKVALNELAVFITNRVVPSLVQFVGFLADKLIPVAIKAGELIVVGFQAASEAVVDFAKTIQPWVQPAIDGFKQLGEAITDAVSGKFSSLGSGAVAALKGLGTTFANIGTALFNNFLKPLGLKVADFFKEAFSTRSLGKAASVALDVIEEVGRIIGNIATDPIILKVAGALAAAAAVIAFRFVKGLAEGIISNLPGLFRVVVDALKEGLSAALDNPEIIVGALTALFAYKRIASLITGLFSRVGSEGGSAFAKGFARNAQGFIQGAFGGSKFADIQNNAALNRTANADILKTQNMLRALGQAQLVSPRNFDAAKAALADLSRQFTDAQIKGLVFRDKVSQAFTGLGGVIHEAVRGNIRNALNILVETGRRTGIDFGKALKAGATAGLSAVGGFFGGQAAGKAGANPLLAALGIGATAGLATGSPLVGLAAGAAAFVGGKLGEAAKKAEDYKAKIDALADSLNIDLVNAFIAAGNAGGDFTDVLGGGDNTDDTFKRAFADLLDPETRANLASLGLTLDDVFAAVKAFGVEGFDLNANLGGEINKVSQVSVHAYKDIANALDVTGAAFDNASDKAIILGKTDVSKLAVQLDTVQRAGERATSSLAAAPATGPVLGGIAGLDTAVSEYGKTIDTTAAKFAALFNPPTDAGSFQGVLDQAVLNVQGLGQAMQQAVADATAEGAGAGDAVISEAKVRQLKQQFGEAVSSAISTGVDDGLVVDENTARFLTNGILQAALAGVTNPDIAAAITAGYEQGISGVQVIIDERNAATLGLEVTQALQSYVDEHPLDVSVTSGTPAAQTYLDELEAYFTANPVDPSIEPNTEEAKTAAAAMVNAIKTDPGIKSAGVGIGENFGQGLADGIEHKGIAVQDAARALANKAVQQTKDSLGVKSPSKVMFGIGENITQGLANGIEDGADDVSDAITKIVDDAVDNAAKAARFGGARLGGAFQSLFASAFGSGTSSFGISSSGGIAAAQSGLTQALAGIRSTFDSVAGAFIDANRAFGEGKGVTASQQDLLGENIFGLSQFETSGAANRQALTSAFDAITNIGAQLLASGQSPQQVADALKGYVDQVEWLAGQLGLSGDQLAELESALGLSDDALQKFASSASQAAAAAELQANETAAAARLAAIGDSGITDKNNDGIDDKDQDFTLAELPRRPVIVNVYPQHGDPEAIGMASANAVAAAVATGAPGYVPTINTGAVATSTAGRGVG